MFKLGLHGQVLVVESYRSGFCAKLPEASPPLAPGLLLAKAEPIRDGDNSSVITDSKGKKLLFRFSCAQRREG